ncbi:uncharacterized protein LOC113360937 [Papaver somniferum]|uniref:uncharacterized protein LOC113360937 n=1 Tax=Papaver somniferum TaxID=3469 RepID=UPI000E6F9FFF|nr:uncharacterized protein LOC113360937 [Papaver somniferum]
MEEPDRISKLPNPILHHILSFIETKCVVQTSILSKRWSHIMAKIIKLNAPNLTSLVCKDLMLQEYSVENLSSLVGADIEMVTEDETNVVEEELEKYLIFKEGRKELYPNRMLKILEGLHNVKELTLSHGCLQVLSAAPNLLERQFPVFSNLRWLKLETTCSLSTVGYLLKISPILESLVPTSMERSLLNEEDDWRASLPFPKKLFSDKLEFEPVAVRDNEFSSADDEDDWEAKLPLPHMLSQLKFVEIKDVQGCDNELKFLEFLFRNAMVLEELILFLCPSNNSSRKYDRIANFSEKVKRLPRASPSVTMIFIYS